MRRVCLLAASLCLSAFICSISFGNEPALTIEDLHRYFSRVSATGDGFQFTVANNLPHFPYRINGQDQGASQPGQTILVPAGAQFEMFEKHSGFRFDPLDAPLRNVGFSVFSYFSGASVGGRNASKSAFLLRTKRASSGTSDEYDVQLLPPETTIAQLAAIVSDNHIEGQLLSPSPSSSYASGSPTPLPSVRDNASPGEAKTGAELNLSSRKQGLPFFIKGAAIILLLVVTVALLRKRLF